MSNWDLLQKEKEFWNGLFSNGFVKTELPNSYNSIRSDYRKSQIKIDFPLPLAKKVIELINNSDTRLFILLKANLLLLLNRYSGENKLSLGMPIYKQEKENLINTVLPMIYQVDEDLSFKDLLKYCNDIF